MKRILAIFLTLLMLVSLTACQSNGNDAELEAMKLQMQLMQQQLNEAKKEGYETSEANQAQEAAPTPEATPEVSPEATPEAVEAEYEEGESGDIISALHSTIDGQTSLIVDGITELTATADIPEGMALDYWELNGAEYYEDMEDAFTFTAQGNTVVDARLRPEHKVTAINAQMQFLDKKGRPKGDKFTEFVFEQDYKNPVTDETLPGDWISVYVKAVIPKDYTVDYWLINDVPYHYNRTVTSFTVFDLNETTVYEVVLKKENASSSTPKPTAKPTEQPVYTSAPTQRPITYYQVSCKYCTFSGGGYSGAASGKVPEGTRITVTSNSTHEVYWEGSNGYGDKWHPEPNSFSYTVNKDCSFEACVIVN